MSIKFFPQSKLGKWSVGLIAAFAIILGVFFLLVASGERGGMTFFSNLKLSLTGLSAGVCGIAAFIVGLISLIKKDRAILVWLATAVGLFVLWFVAAELLFPH